MEYLTLTEKELRRSRRINQAVDWLLGLTLGAVGVWFLNNY